MYDDFDNDQDFNVSIRNKTSLVNESTGENHRQGSNYSQITDTQFCIESQCALCFPKGLRSDNESELINLANSRGTIRGQMVSKQKDLFSACIARTRGQSPS